MKAEVKGNTLVVTIDLDANPKETEKMFLIASSGGFRETGLNHKGHDIKVNLMAGYKK